MATWSIRRTPGDKSTLAIMRALRQAGYSVLLPFGENTRYDLVIDDGESLARVQCKTGRMVQGAVIFRTSSTYLHHPHPKVSSRHYRNNQVRGIRYASRYEIARVATAGLRASSGA